MDLLIDSRTILQTTPLRWSNLVQAVSTELIDLAPAEGEWSALDCLQHIVDVERWVFPLRVRAFLAGENFPSFDPDSQGEISSRTLSAAELAAQFAAMRRDSLALLDTVTTADLNRTVIHAALGKVTLSELIHEWAAHDLMHTVQAEQAMMQPFIAGCGPWQSFFADHVAKK